MVDRRFKIGRRDGARGREGKDNLSSAIKSNVRKQTTIWLRKSQLRFLFFSSLHLALHLDNERISNGRRVSRNRWISNGYRSCCRSSTVAGNRQAIGRNSIDAEWHRESTAANHLSAADDHRDSRRARESAADQHPRVCRVRRSESARNIRRAASHDCSRLN